MTNYNTYKDNIQFAKDCAVEVANQHYALKYPFGDFEYGDGEAMLTWLDPEEFDTEDREDFDLETLQKATDTYIAIIETVENLLSASKDTLEGLEKALAIVKA